VSKKLNTATLYSLFKTLETIHDIHTMYIVDDSILNESLHSKSYNSNYNVREITTEFSRFINSNFHIQNYQYINSTTIFDKNIIQSNVSQELDLLMCKELQINDNISKIQMYFNNIIKKNEKPSKELDYIKSHELSYQVRR
jgi:hypothetical protein